MSDRMSSDRRPVVLCADDYGMNEGVSRGILALAESGRISATSCMTNSPHWPQAGRVLAASAARIGVGLHLTLTWGRPVGAMPVLARDGTFPALGRIVTEAVRPMGRSLDQNEIRIEIERQLGLFCEVMGRAPDFLDGHQHVHVLPGIRAPLLDVLARSGLANRLWLRDPSDGAPAILNRRLSAAKALFVGALARGFRRDAGRVGFRTNDGFSGFSPFDPARDPAPDMESYLTALGPRPVVMCHPGLPDPDPDEIAVARMRELAYLQSPGFQNLLARRGMVLAPAPD